MRRLALAAIVALTACGGGGSSSLPPTSAKSANANTNATMRLTIPSKSAAGVRAKYVSTSTQSVVLTVNGTALPAFGTTPSSPGCSANNGGTVCSLAFSAAVGSATIGVKAYDAASGGGNLLSQGTVTQTLVAGTNVVPVIMGGVTASLSVSAPAINAGTAGTTPVVVQAKDADGNTIVGPGNYSTPVTVTDGDTSGITTLAVNGTAEGTSATVNSPNDVVALRYNGKNLAIATLTPSASGVSAVTPGAFAPSATATYFPMPPSNISNPTNIAVGGDGNLWIAAQGSPGALYKMTTSGTFTEFDPGVAPSTALPNAVVQGLSGTSAGSAAAAWFILAVGGPAPRTALGSIAASGVVTMYSTPSWCGGNFGFPQAITSDGQGGAWFTTFCSSLPTSDIQHVSSTGTITSTSIPFVSSGIFVGKDGNLYLPGCSAVSCTSSTASVMQATVSGTTVTGTNLFVTGVSNTGSAFGGIAQSDDGDFWMNDGAGTIARLQPAAIFSNSTFTSYVIPGGQSFPQTAFSGGNNTVWMGNSTSIASVTEIIPAANQGAPTQVTVPLSALPGSAGNYVSGALGPDGYLYFVNDSSTNTLSGEVAKIAY